MKMSRDQHPYRHRATLGLLVFLVLLAAGLRLHRLGAASLTGDEAFAVRYWAQSPPIVLNGLAWIEPHPFGTFFGFWAWKSLVGDSEFAMRMLSALVNLLGVPAIYALTRQLLNRRSVALCAALLWAINPYMIWHSQDARNYAIWAALSVLSLWLLMRATSRSRRIDWLLYIVSTTLGLYVFFLEALIVIVHGLYVVGFRRRALRPWLISMLIVAVLLIPWLGQLWALSHTGYSGTAQRADFNLLITQFIPSLLFGEGLNSPWAAAISLIVVATLIFHFTGIYLFYSRQSLKFLLILLFIPAAFLFITATRLDVFRPRYLIALAPALLIPIAGTLGIALKVRLKAPVAKLWIAILALVLLAPFTVLTVDALANYYSPSYRKGADWRTLGDFLKTNVTAHDAVILTSPDGTTGYTDPAFDYYYSGPPQVNVLPYPKVDINASAASILGNSRDVWVVLAGSDVATVTEALQTNGMLINTYHPGEFVVREFRTKAVQPGEIEMPLDLHVSGGVISGYSIIGSPITGTNIAVLLFWNKPPAAGLKTFVHLLGPAKPDGSPVWAQDDHPPAMSGRDVYSINLEAVPAGVYRIEFGLYDPVTGARSQLVDGSGGNPLGESFVLPELSITAK